MPERELLVRIVGDDRALQAAFARSSRGAQQFESRSQKIGQNVTRAFGAAGVALGASALFAFSKRAIDAASDLNEEITKSQKVFGDSADEIAAWSETTASALGISQTQALQATGTFGNLFRTVQIGEADAAGMSRTLTELAADLGSFNNANIDDVLLAIRSGLIGEAEPLRRYGVLLSEARVQQVALANTGKRSVTELTNQEKALARYQIILEDTIPAQGDFADTIGGLANQQKIAAAETQELATSFGQLLAPAEEIALAATIGFVGGVNDAIDAMKGWRSELRDTDAFDGWNSAVDGAAQHASDFFLGLRDGIPFLTDFKEAVQGAFDQTPFDTTTTGTRDESETGSPGAVSASNAAVRARQADAAARRARQQLTESRKRFAEFTKGLELKLKRAGLSDDLDDDLRVLREIEQRIRRQIAEEGRTYALVNDLTDVQLRIARTEQQQADRVADAAQDAADARSDAADRRREANERARDARNAEQFLALGLTSTGDQRVPGIGALRRRGRSLIEQLKDSGLDDSQIRRSVQRISVVFTSQFRTASREVRQAILSLFNDIAAALDEGTGKVAGNRTKFRVVNTSNILAGLGLSEEEQRALRSRLSRVGAGGTTSQTSGVGGAFGLNTGGGGNIIINGPITVVANDPADFNRKLGRVGRSEGAPRTGSRG